MMGRDGFSQVLLAEWTKFRSVRSMVWTAILAIGLTILLSMFAASASNTDANEGPRYVDQFHFVHRPMTGDGTLVAQVVSQRGGEWARAGIMLKQDTRPGSPFAAIMVTPRHGVRMQGGFGTELVRAGGAPRWLRLTRSGTTVTGFSSVDGTTWTSVGTVRLATGPRVEAGLFVTSPTIHMVRKGSSSGAIHTTSTAVFDNVRPDGAAFSDLDVGGAARNIDGTTTAGGSTRAGPVFTVTGTGDVRALRPGEPGDDDLVMNSLTGVFIGLIAFVALGVLFMTSEYQTNVIRTTLTASPRRGRVLAAKAVVIGASGFAAGLVASFGAFFLAQPIQRRNGFRPPAYPHPSLADERVLRSVVGTALFLALIALFGLAVGAIWRRTAGAITLVIALVVVPAIAGSFLTVDGSKWVQRLTPLAGLAIQQTRPRFDTPIGPWAGLAVLFGYIVAAFGVAFWLLRKRDA